MRERHTLRCLLLERLGTGKKTEADLLVGLKGTSRERARMQLDALVIEGIVERRDRFYRITEVGSGPIDELLAEQHTADPVGAGDSVNC